jgi:quercetin dioxygenase-like cupin family protein
MAQVEIVRQTDVAQVDTAIPGLHRRTMAAGERVMVCEFFLERGTVVPMHSHMHEQCGYVLSGNITFTVEGQEHTLDVGDTYAIPGDVPHSAVANTDTVLVEVFSPPREEFR